MPSLFYCCTFLIAFFFTPVLGAYAATLSLTPGTGVYEVGSTFSARVVVNTEGKPINAAEATLRFDPTQLSVVSIARGSIFNLWTVEPTFSNTAGTITFGGGSPSGYTGSAGTILTVTFRSRAAETARVTYGSGSVLAADGLGTNVLRTMNGGTFTLTAASENPTPEVVTYVPPANTPAAPVITSPTHPDQTAWYQANVATLRWEVPAGVTGVRTLLSESSSAVPTRVYDTPISELVLEDLEEGEQYFHIQFRNADGWGRVASYRLAVDTTPPANFSVSLAEGVDERDASPALAFRFDEAGSGVRRYLVQVNGDTPYEFLDETGSSTHTLATLTPGYHAVVVEAFDGAGNSAIATLNLRISAFEKPLFTQYPAQLNEGVVPVIEGLTKPGAVVTVSIARVGAQAVPATYQVTADSDGVFRVIPDGGFTTGVYELTANATDADGAISETSDVVRMNVAQPGFVRVGSLVVSVMSVVVPLLGLLVLCGLALVYGWRHFVAVRATVVRETSEALAIADREFGMLLATLEEEEAALRGSRKTQSLTKVEAALVTTMRERILGAKQRVTKEIQDVDHAVE